MSRRRVRSASGQYAAGRPTGPAPRRDSRGATILEYGLIVAGIAGVLFLGAMAFGEQLSGVFSTFVRNVQTQSPGGTVPNPDPTGVVVSPTKSSPPPEPSPDPSSTDTSSATGSVPTGP